MGRDSFRTLPFLYLIFLNRLFSTASLLFNGSTLVIGDSWGALSKTYLSSVCSLTDNDFSNVVRVVTNNAKSGSTALEWKEGESAKKSFENGKDYDFVWLSAGGNDFLGTQCLTVFPQGVNSFIGGLFGEGMIADSVLDIIADVVESSNNPNLKILFTGYGYPSEELCPDDDTIDKFDSLNAKIRSTIRNSAYSSRVVTVDISSLFVAPSSSPFSSTLWYADTIHLNEAGYDKLFAQPIIQDFFECTTADSSSPTLTLSTHPSLSPTRSVKPSPSPTLSAHPSTSPSNKPSFRPTLSLEPSLSPSTLPSFGPTVSHAPTLSAQPSYTPTLSLSPSSMPSLSDTCSSSSDSGLLQTCTYRHILSDSFTFHYLNSHIYLVVYYRLRFERKSVKLDQKESWCRYRHYTGCCHHHVSCDIPILSKET